MFLSSTDHTLEAVMGAAVDTAAPEFVISYADHTTTTFIPDVQLGVLNGTTDVTILDAPAASTQRQVKNINIYNKDAITQEFTVHFDDNGTERILFKGDIPSNEVLTWASETGWRMGNVPETSGALQNVVEDLTPEAGGVFDMNNFMMKLAKGSNIASPAGGTLSVPNDGNRFFVTGTNSITDISNEGIGTVILLEFQDVLTLVDDGVLLKLPNGGDDIVTAANDTALFFQDGTFNWICHHYQRADGTALVNNTGHIDVFATATFDDDHAVEINMDAAGFGSVSALDIFYTTGAVSTGEEETAILINLDEFDATGGEIFGIEVLATSGNADEIWGLKAGALVGPIEQESGAFANPTTGTNNTTSTDVAAMIDGSEGTNTTIFVADDDYILIGAAAAFTEIAFNIETPAGNPGIKPTFGYSTAGAHQFTMFSPTDGTNAFRNSGVIAWEAADLSGHTTNSDTGTFDIKITRTHASAGNVSLFFAETATTIKYHWDKDGVVKIASVIVDTQTPSSASDTGVAGTMTWDADFIYICTATDTWERVAIATW